jgi:nitroreductase
VLDTEAFFELLRTQRAVRLFTDQPVDDATVQRLIAMSVRAPNGGNQQPWHYIVVRDRETKAALGKIFDELGQQIYGANAPERTPWVDVPVLIVVCTQNDPAREALMGASVYPAVQNLLLTAHAMGLGSVLTTRWKAREPEVKPILGLPEGYTPQAILPIGWPARKYGRSRRKRVAEITSREKFGQPWT